MRYEEGILIPKPIVYTWAIINTQRSTEAISGPLASSFDGHSKTDLLIGWSLFVGLGVSPQTLDRESGSHYWASANFCIGLPHEGPQHFKQHPIP